MNINEKQWKIKPGGRRSNVLYHGGVPGGSTWTLKTVTSLKSLNTCAPLAMLRGSGAHLTTIIDSVREWRHPHAPLSHRMLTCFHEFSPESKLLTEKTSTKLNETSMNINEHQ